LIDKCLKILKNNRQLSMISNIDKEILKHLIKNGRLSFRDISRKSKLSVSTIAKRVRQMEKEKIIKGYSTILDYEKLGYDLTAVTEVIVSKGKLIEIEKMISKIPNVCAVYDVTGLTDVIVIAKFKNRKELSNFTKLLLSMPFVERTNTHIVLTTVKEDFRMI